MNPGFTALTGDPITFFEQLGSDPRFEGGVARQVRDEGVSLDPDAAACTPGTKDTRVMREARIGAPCGTPANATCENELACFYVKTGWNPYTGTNGLPSHIFFVFGKNAALTAVTTRAELLARITPIDTGPKAGLLFSVDTSFRTRVVAYRIAVGGGIDLQVRGGGACAGEAIFDAEVHVSPEGVITEMSRVTSTEPIGGCGEGRRPIGLLECPRGGLERGVGDYLAEAAFLEAAAVVAFEQMAGTLRAFGAPARLVRAAESARCDEIRHARMMSTLARRFGTEPREVRLDEPEAITLEALAIDNAIEGCVRETYAVVRAMWQAQHAEDAHLRAAFSILAREELRHAELSWDLDRWLRAQLDAPARARVEDARRRTIEELRYELHAAPHPEVVRVAGMPDVQTGLRLLHELVARTALVEAA